MSLPRACITLKLDDVSMARLGAACDTFVASPATAGRAAVISQLADAEGILCSALFPIDNELLDAAPKLRVVSNFGVGYNNVDVEELTRRGIVICNTPGVLSACVADLTIGLILAFSRRIVDSANFVKSGSWNGKNAPPPVGFDVFGKTIGLVGYGRIGRETAVRARAFGMKVLYYDLFTDPGAGDDAEYRDLDDLLRESDILSIHTNLTADTTHMISTREFGLMKRSAIVVNTARGPVIDEVALAEALHAGTIAGAALDVVETEPPAADAPILSAPNTIILPHVGSATVETRAAMLDLCLSNLEAVMRREVPIACVNPEALERALAR